MANDLNKTTVRCLSRPFLEGANSAGAAWRVLVLLVVLGASASAQQAPRHWLHAGDMPLGAIGAQRMLRSGPLSVHPRPAYIQPVEVLVGEQRSASALEEAAPAVAIASGGGWTADQYGRMLVGLEVGRPYRLRVTGVPLYEETPVYPTIELVDRLHPPPGKLLKFPVPVELTTRELQMAARGSFVTRVIYVEDPMQALPIAQKHGQPYVEAAPGEDPLLAADQLGRPIAILRIGARGPGPAGPSPTFTFGGPAVQMYGEQPLEAQRINEEVPSEPAVVPTSL